MDSTRWSVTIVTAALTACSGSAGPEGPAGAKGDAGTSVVVASLDPGSACTFGGSQLTAGTATSYACNGAPGAQGLQGAPGPGLFRGLFCGFSAATTGDMGGWSGARALCVGTCPSSPGSAHLCTSEEAAKAYQLGVAFPAEGAWVATSLMVASVVGGTGGSVTSRSDLFANYRGCCNWDVGQTAVSGVTLPSPVSATVVTNCSGWTGSGTGLVAQATDFGFSACTATLTAACCD